MTGTFSPRLTSDSTLRWNELAELNPDQLFLVPAVGWREASHRAHSAAERSRGEMVTPLQATQKGEDAEVAVAQIQRLCEDFSYIHQECGLVASALEALAAELAAPHAEVCRALDEAQARGFTILGDGSVSYPEAPSQTGGEGAVGPEGVADAGGGVFDISGQVSDVLRGQENPNYPYAKDIADRIAAAVSTAREVDAQYADLLRDLDTTDEVAVTDAAWADADRDAGRTAGLVDDALGTGVPGDHSTPAETKKWWDGLSEEEREQELALHPEEIGNRNGIPSDVRDEANRTNIRAAMGQLEEDDSDGAQAKLKGLQSIQAQLDARSDPPMYLLGVGTEGNGRAIVSYGNPDTSRNVSAYVPGLGTSLNAGFAGGDLKRARNTALGAQSHDPSSASIVWLGYDAPQTGSGIGDVAAEGDARKGGTAYNDFMAGISATNENADPHVTAIGHSYGSLTVGQAAQQDGGIPGVDDIILVGSPGTGADKASDLGLSGDHVYVGAAENDPVTHAPSKAETGGAVAGGLLGGPIGAIGGAVVGHAVDGGDNGWFGTDPAEASFGGTRFAVADGPTVIPNGTAAHSNYFDPVKDPESAKNIGKIVAGQGSTVSREEPR
ncbi:alpha/beta hydrolase [Streptomyces beijiangensis]|uniref:DUF1023 domain-containing protein n=1 Tax=Streptomyces beijiangensis TaxID=163361 RepID=A0A939FAQ2_9ACTN|nr:alpha/beta hydrolase [Streptomyces beijiangensis]MBO0515545.1 hypothetical protein [Streptomyces beijiangensis]